MRARFSLKSSKFNNKFANPNQKLLKFFHTQQNQNPTSSPFSFLSPTHLNSLLNTATHNKNIRHASQIHAQIITNNFISLSFLFNNLLNLYAKCGHLNKSLTLFSNTKNESKNIVSWTSLITQLSHSNDPHEALAFLKKMMRSGVCANQFTLSAILPACAETRIVIHGEQVHSLICKLGFELHLFVASALVDMYAKCGDMKLAERVFDEMPDRNVVSWNSMIVGFLKNKLYGKAIGFFKEVLGETSVIPNEVSFSSGLSACANMDGVGIGRQVHGVVVKYGLIPLAYVKNSVMDMYCKCGLIEDAFRLFQTIEDRDVVTWNIIIMGYVQNGNFEEACNYFWSMRSEGIFPDEASFSTAVHAVASIAALDQGTLLHNQVIKSGFGLNLCIVNSLIKMYSKCGSLVDARRVFAENEDRNVITWTSMISACQQHGCVDKVIELFEDMLEQGIEPSYVTFVCVLSSFSYTGRVDEGFHYFNSMRERYSIDPGHEHYACMVDLLSRAGQLGEAKSFVEAMPIEPNVSVWGALLGACRRHGDLEMGIEVAKRLFEIEPDNPGNYVLLCNMYTHNGMLEEANEIRRLMGVKGVRKETGCSWIDIKNKTYVFTCHDRSHDKTSEIYEMLAKLEKLVKKKGYVAQSKYAVNTVEVEKEQSLWHHSEKLALAFGLPTLPAGASIRIKKNLRTCGDCHTVLKFASEIFDREIIVRDTNRFHRFACGLCSCGDYW